MRMEQFYVKAGDLLLTIHDVRGDFPRRKFVVRFEYDNGRAEYDGDDWTRHIYADEEQHRIDAERAACA